MKDQARSTVIMAREVSAALDELCAREERSRNYLMNKAIKSLLEAEGLLPAITKKRNPLRPIKHTHPAQMVIKSCGQANDHVSHAYLVDGLNFGCPGVPDIREGQK